MGQAAVFLDRDGVLNVDHGYTHKPETLEWQPGAREAVAAIKNAGYLAIVVTNQSGIARGYYTEVQMDAFHSEMNAQLKRIGTHIDAFYFCPYHAKATVSKYLHADHPDRKPNPGMILRAVKDWSIDLSASFLVGDKTGDIEAARRASVTGLLYGSGRLDDLINAQLVPRAEGHSR